MMRPITYLLMIACFVGELLLFSSERGSLGVYVSPLLWLGFGLGFSCCAFRLMSTQPHGAQLKTRISSGLNTQVIRIILSALVALGVGYFIHARLSIIYHNTPIDPHISDILPSMEYYARRWLSGEKVYAPMVFPGWTVLPTYFPLMWMPYALAEAGNFDYRLVAFGGLAFAFLLWSFWLSRQSTGWIEWAGKVLLPWLVWLYLVREPDTSWVYGATVEFTPVAYYLLVCLALLATRSIWWWGLSLLLVLLSRYAYTFWLPLLFVVIWLKEGFWKSFKTGLVMLLGVLLLYVGPFLLEDPSIFTNGLAYYKQTAIGQWQAEGAVRPTHIGNGLSTAVFFYDFGPESLEERLSWARFSHLLACLGAVGLIVLGYFRKGRHNWRIFMVIALKFYITVFYGFFYVPFGYLFILPLMLCLPVIWALPGRLK